MKDFSKGATCLLSIDAKNRRKLRCLWSAIAIQMIKSPVGS